MTTEQEELFKMAHGCRQHLGPGLLEAEPGRSEYEGACLYASVYLASTLNRFGLATASIAGGGGDVDQGARDASGHWCGHYWVVAQLKDGDQFVVDITADQFGMPPVVMIPLGESESRYRPGPQPEVDAAAVMVATELGLLDLIGIS